MLFPTEGNFGFIGLIILFIVVVVDTASSLGSPESIGVLLFTAPAYIGISVFLLIYSHLEQRY